MDTHATNERASPRQLYQEHGPSGTVDQQLTGRTVSTIKSQVGKLGLSQSSKLQYWSKEEIRCLMDAVMLHGTDFRVIGLLHVCDTGLLGRVDDTLGNRSTRAQQRKADALKLIDSGPMMELPPASIRCMFFVINTMNVFLVSPMIGFSPSSSR